MKQFFPSKVIDSISDPSLYTSRLIDGSLFLPSTKLNV